jgi:multidrug efflux pump subunit AcrA (membrane-fusion protein)
LTKVEIRAPFDGFVMQVNVKGGDRVNLGAVAVSVADPKRFEANVLVGEMDIAQLAEGGVAQVAVDSLSGLTLPATITHISPRANIQSGVVNYIVTVELAPLEQAAARRPEAGAGTRPQLDPGQISERMQQAIDSGQMTQEQAAAVMERIREGGAQGAPGGQMAPRPQMSPENIQLRQGLSVTITLVVEQATDVLLVPNTAISYKGPQAYVKVMTAAGDIEQREVSVGISNWTNTVITDGLTEGETIVVSQTSASAAGEEESRGGGGIGSMGRMFR